MTGPLAARKCENKMQHVDFPRGHCSLEGVRSPMQMWEYMVEPILPLMEWSRPT